MITILITIHKFKTGKNIYKARFLKYFQEQKWPEENVLCNVSTFGGRFRGYEYTIFGKENREVIFVKNFYLCVAN